MRRRTALVLTAALLAAVASRAGAQDTTAVVPTLATATTALGVSPRTLRELLEDPETLNAALQQLLHGQHAPWQLLRNLDVRFLTFETQDGERQGLGLAYDYDQAIKRQLLAQHAARVTSLDMRLVANGNLAFDRAENPTNFLDTKLALSLSRSVGGAIETTPAERGRLAALRDSLALIETEAELEASPLLREYMGVVRQHLTTQFYTALSASASLESDQSFRQTQWVYGVTGGVDLKAWNPTSTLAQWNLFDWPFAALRYLAGTDQRFTPRGWAFPTVQLALASVDASDDTTRAVLGARTVFPRLRAEAAFRTLAFDTDLGPIYFQSDFRWYHELGAQRAVRDAGLDDFAYFAASLVSAAGPFVSFTSGHLPLDVRSDQVYQLGWRLYF